MLQPHRGLICADIPSPVCKGRGLATAAGLDSEQDCAHSAQPLCAKTKARLCPDAGLGSQRLREDSPPSPHRPPLPQPPGQHLDPVRPWHRSLIREAS